MRYIISEDILVLLSLWAQKNDYVIPHSLIKLLRQRMYEELKNIFGDIVEIISEEKLRQGLQTICQQTDLPIVSLDRSYLQHKWQININRVVDKELNDLCEKERFGYAPLSDQITTLKKAGLRQIALLDDVIFSGNGIISLTDQLEKAGIKVEQIIAGIVVGEGNDRIAKRRIPISAVCRYESVIDEICERDFYPGVPFSGRTIDGLDANIGAPYLYPFGKPEEWASIPADKAKSFSDFCLRQTIDLWRGIETASKKPVRCSDIDRLPLGAPNGSEKFSDFLSSLL